LGIKGFLPVPFALASSLFISTADRTGAAPAVGQPRRTLQAG